MKTRSFSTLATGESLFFDAALLIAASLFFTGGTFWLTSDLHALFRQKPFLHRGILLTIEAFIFFWYVARAGFVQKGSLPASRIVSFLSALKISPQHWVWLTFLATTALWTASAWVRHAAFHTSFDMAIFTQAIWNTANGSLLYSSIKGGINLLGDHFSPILILLALPYAVWPDPKVLLFIQSAAAASAIFPIHSLGRHYLQDDRKPLLFIFAYAFYLPVINAVRFDFHPEVLAIPMLLTAFYFLIQQRLLLSSLLLALSILTKESAATVTFAVGFYAFVFVRRRFFGAAWMIFSVIYFFGVLRCIPVLFGQDYFYLNANFLAWQRLGPSALAQHLFRISSAAYIFKIFMPLGFLSLLSPSTVLLTLPMLAQNLIARNEITRSIFFQYTAYLTPFVFISAMAGFRKILSHRGGVFYLAFCILCMSGVAELHVIHGHLRQIPQQAQSWESYFQSLPPNVSVRTHEFFAPHLANRRELHIFENDNPREGGALRALSADLVILESSLLGSRAAEVPEQLAAHGYSLTRQDHGLMVFERRSSS